jgi:hypothetical protein
MCSEVSEQCWARWQQPLQLSQSITLRELIDCRQYYPAHALFCQFCQLQFECMSLSSARAIHSQLSCILALMQNLHRWSRQLNSA